MALLSGFRLSRAGLVVVAIGAVTAVAACGSSSSKGSPESSVPAPTGTPIKIMQWTPAAGNNASELGPSADAAVKSINAAGGIKDVAGGPNHPLQLLTCTVEAGETGAQAQVCARQALDAKVVALSGKFQGADDSVKALIAAGIPIVDAYGSSGTSDFTDPMSFPLSSGSSAEGAALGSSLQAAGASKIVIALADAAGARPLVPLISKGLKNGAADVLGTVYVPLDPSADVTSYVAQMTDKKPDGVAVFCTPDGTVRVIKALRDSGFKGPISTSAFLMTNATITGLATAADNVIVVSNFAAPTDKVDPTIKKYVASMDQYSSKTSRSELSIGAWVSVNVIAQALGVAKTQDAAGLAAALQGLKITEGAAPPYTLGVTGIKLLPFPRVPRSTVQVQIIKGGQVTALKDGQFLDVDNPSVPVTSG